MGDLKSVSANKQVSSNKKQITVGAGWTLYWDFEGTKIGQSSAKVAGGFLHGANESYFDNQHLIPGSTRNLRMHVRKGVQGAIADLGARIYFDEELALRGSKEDGKVRKGQTIWINFKAYFPEEFDWNCVGAPGDESCASEGIKFTRLRGYGLSGNADIKVEGYAGIHIHEERDPDDPRIMILNEVSGSGHPDASDYGLTFNERWYSNKRKGGILDKKGLAKVSKGVWHTFEMMLKVDHVQNRGGIYRTWLDGNIIINDTITHTSRHDYSYTDQLFFFTNWNGRSTQSQDCWIDRIKITTITPSGFDDETGSPMIGV